MSKRTLLSVNNYFYPRAGAEVVFLEQMRLLEGAGWEVVPFSMHHPQNLPSEWDEYFIEELQLGHDYTLLEKFKRVQRVIYSFEARDKLRKLLDVIEPEACLIHNVYHHISPSILSLLRERGIPIALTVHDLKIACPAYKMLNRTGICERCRGGRYSNILKHRCAGDSLVLSSVLYLEATLHRYLDSYARNVDRFIVPSRFLIDKMAEWGVERNKMVHIRNFVNLEPFRPRKCAGKRFLYFGRMAPEKGLDTLLHAAAKAGVSLRFVGTGPEDQALRSLAVELDLDVEFSGYLTGAPLVEAVRDARAVVLPSQWYENAPVSILEAYAEGVPVVGADIGGIPELIEHGRTGRIFTSGDAQALAAQLTWFADLDDETVLTMGHNGRELLEKDFSGDAHKKQLFRLLEEMGIDAINEAQV